MLTAEDILHALGMGEELDWEFKCARGGLPLSLWETYSAMANADGGVIVLGVEQHGDEFSIAGLPDPARMRKNFWDTINNRGKVSANLLRDDDAVMATVEGQPILAVKVPRALRRERPVYVGQNPIRGTYRRNFEGDYKCSEEEVGRMLADRSEEPADSRILAGFGLDDLDSDSLQHYRQRFSARVPDHP
ncbi:MAG: ATP-binding protein [Candidatus Eisenbacteria sp.]|nr:ATP-binding protein [Candidatus Eisenbacteria bacterium]